MHFGSNFKVRYHTKFLSFYAIVLIYEGIPYRKLIMTVNSCICFHFFVSIVEEPIEEPLEYYSDEGNHFVFLNEEWKKEECTKDREALKNLFQHQGYLRYEDGKVNGLK